MCSTGVPRRSTTRVTRNSKPLGKGGKPNATPPDRPLSPANPPPLQRDQIASSSLTRRYALEGQVPVLAEPIHEGFPTSKGVLHSRRGRGPDAAQQVYRSSLDRR